jgi:hypothetical protein
MGINEAKPRVFILRNKSTAQRLTVLGLENKGPGYCAGPYASQTTVTINQ